MIFKLSVMINAYENGKRHLLVQEVMEDLKKIGWGESTDIRPGTHWVTIHYMLEQRDEPETDSP